MNPNQLQNQIAESFRRAWQGQLPGTPGQHVVPLSAVMTVSAGSPLAQVRLVGRWEVVEPLATQWSWLGWESGLLAGPAAASAGVPWDVPRLQRWADEVVRRVQYLPETLRLWEIDQPDGVAVVRSTDPTRVDGQREFFELTCRAEGGGLCRWQVAADGTRTPQSFPLVHATAFRALADLVLSLG